MCYRIVKQSTINKDEQCNNSSNGNHISGNVSSNSLLATRLIRYTHSIVYSYLDRYDIMNNKITKIPVSNSIAALTSEASASSIAKVTSQASAASVAVATSFTAMCALVP